MTEDPIIWASAEDRRLVERDGIWYGTAFVKRNEAGLLERVDPSTITPSKGSPEYEAMLSDYGYGISDLIIAVDGLSGG